MQARITKSFLAALSLLGVLTLPSIASAHDEDYDGNRRVMQQEFDNSPYTNREHLQLRRFLSRNYQDHYHRYSYNDDHSGNRWYNERQRYGKKYSQGKSCQFPRQTYGNDRQYRPRYYGNDYYGNAR
jgi:hypothetical protein